MPLVIDASALVHATTSTAASRLRRRLRDDVVHAPHLIDAEVGNVLRRMTLHGTIAPEHGAAILQDAPRLVDHRYDHLGTLAAAAWALRENVTFYDALYAALAAALDIPLLTADAKLATAPGLPCVVVTP